MSAQIARDSPDQNPIPSGAGDVRCPPRRVCSQNEACSYPHQEPNSVPDADSCLRCLSIRSQLRHPSLSRPLSIYIWRRCAFSTTTSRRVTTPLVQRHVHQFAVPTAVRASTRPRPPFPRLRVILLSSHHSVTKTTILIEDASLPLRPHVWILICYCLHRNLAG